ncbi:MAG: MBL fold metallo-hydrolase [Clostridia bacterium]|nr:MBL fold metallo-hydrolase [Clostridia bacterium]
MLAKVLIDNIADKSYCSEWGLSVHIEHNGKNILLDTGASGRFSENAKKMGIDLEKIDYGVLSHAHYDHSDGMDNFFKLNSKAKFFLRKPAQENCYGRRFIFSRYIGIKKGLTEKYKNRIEYVSGTFEVCDGVYLLGHTTDNLDIAGKKAGMYIKKDKRFLPDDFSHEQSLVIRTSKGLLIFNSCSHGGADNIINEVSREFPQEPIYALIGGFHLYRSSENEVRELAERIKKTGIEKIYTGHCTGEKAFRLLAQELPGKAFQLRVGLEIEA